MAPGEHFDIAAMTQAAEAPELNCKVVEEIFSHLAELPLARQLSVLKQIEHKNAEPLKPGEQRVVQLFAQEAKDGRERIVTLVREGSMEDYMQSIYIGSFIGEELTEVRICGEPQKLPPRSPESHPHKK